MLDNIYISKYNQNNRGYCQLTSFLFLLNHSVMKQLSEDPATNFDCDNYQISMNDLLKCFKEKLYLKPDDYSIPVVAWEVYTADTDLQDTITIAPYFRNVNIEYDNLKLETIIYIYDNMPKTDYISRHFYVVGDDNGEGACLYTLARLLLENNGGGGPTEVIKDTLTWKLTEVDLRTKFYFPEYFLEAKLMGVSDDQIDFLDNSYLYSHLINKTIILKKREVLNIPYNLAISFNDTMWMSSIGTLKELEDSVEWYFQSDDMITSRDVSFAQLIQYLLSNSTITTKLIKNDSQEILDENKISPLNNSGFFGICCVGGSSTEYFDTIKSKSECLAIGGEWIDCVYGFDPNDPEICSKNLPTLCNNDEDCQYVTFTCNISEIPKIGILENEEGPYFDLDKWLGDLQTLLTDGPFSCGLCNTITALALDGSPIQLGEDGITIASQSIDTQNPLPQGTVRWTDLLNNFYNSELRIYGLHITAHEVVLYDIESEQLENNDILYTFYIQNSWVEPWNSFTVKVSKNTMLEMIKSKMRPDDPLSTITYDEKILPINLSLSLQVKDVSIISHSTNMCTECTPTPIIQSYLPTPS